MKKCTPDKSKRRSASAKPSQKKMKVVGGKDMKKIMRRPQGR